MRKSQIKLFLQSIEENKIDTNNNLKNEGKINVYEGKFKSESENKNQKINETLLSTNINFNSSLKSNDLIKTDHNSHKDSISNVENTKLYNNLNSDAKQNSHLQNIMVPNNFMGSKIEPYRMNPVLLNQEASDSDEEMLGNTESEKNSRKPKESISNVKKTSNYEQILDSKIVDNYNQKKRDKDSNLKNHKNKNNKNISNDATNTKNFKSADKETVDKISFLLYNKVNGSILGGRDGVLNNLKGMLATNQIPKHTYQSTLEDQNECRNDTENSHEEIEKEKNIAVSSQKTLKKNLNSQEISCFVDKNANIDNEDSSSSEISGEPKNITEETQSKGILYGYGASTDNQNCKCWRSKEDKKSNVSVGKNFLGAFKKFNPISSLQKKIDSSNKGYKLFSAKTEKSKKNTFNSNKRFVPCKISERNILSLVEPNILAEKDVDYFNIEPFREKITPVDKKDFSFSEKRLFGLCDPKKINIGTFIKNTRAENGFYGNIQSHNIFNNFKNSSIINKLGNNNQIKNSKLNIIPSKLHRKMGLKSLNIHDHNTSNIGLSEHIRESEIKRKFLEKSAQIGKSNQTNILSSQKSLFKFHDKNLFSDTTQNNKKNRILKKYQESQNINSHSNLLPKHTNNSVDCITLSLRSNPLKDGSKNNNFSTNNKKHTTECDSEIVKKFTKNLSCYGLKVKASENFSSSSKINESNHKKIYDEKGLNKNKFKSKYNFKKTAFKGSFKEFPEKLTNISLINDGKNFGFYTNVLSQIQSKIKNKLLPIDTNFHKKPKIGYMFGSEYTSDKSKKTNVSAKDEYYVSQELGPLDDLSIKTHCDISENQVISRKLDASSKERKILSDSDSHTYNAQVIKMTQEKEKIDENELFNVLKDNIKTKENMSTKDVDKLSNSSLTTSDSNEVSLGPIELKSCVLSSLNDIKNMHDTNMSSFMSLKNNFIDNEDNTSEKSFNNDEKSNKSIENDINSHNYQKTVETTNNDKSKVQIQDQNSSNIDNNNIKSPKMDFSILDKQSENILVQIISNNDLINAQNLNTTLNDSGCSEIESSYSIRKITCQNETDANSQENNIIDLIIWEINLIKNSQKIEKYNILSEYFSNIGKNILLNYQNTIKNSISIIYIDTNHKFTKKIYEQLFENKEKILELFNGLLKNLNFDKIYNKNQNNAVEKTNNLDLKIIIERLEDSSSVDKSYFSLLTDNFIYIKNVINNLVYSIFGTISEDEKEKNKIMDDISQKIEALFAGLALTMSNLESFQENIYSAIDQENNVTFDELRYNFSKNKNIDFVLETVNTIYLKNIKSVFIEEKIRTIDLVKNYLKNIEYESTNYILTNFDETEITVHGIENINKICAFSLSSLELFMDRYFDKIIYSVEKSMIDINCVFKHDVIAFFNNLYGEIRNLNSL
ncbi:hypothetical protein EDEG_00038 [Edhazardia aedis USNM 41457]|uniref:Uncharacterized protein n=1 Tax=Edhazardia aedis (strain USNM 41457) TaxID=1003232 RepID=J9D1J0_EDHAE|nr:hypothetical protein EDEG_00038 [Edhazardia aedis USNM 41457]|eukprot:EJW01444.1 hypothetical protein EDEG_00038 [Edhazardia aedis USNM 41457]